MICRLDLGVFSGIPKLARQPVPAVTAHTKNDIPSYPTQRSLSLIAFPGAATSGFYGNMERPAIVGFLKPKMRAEV